MSPRFLPESGMVVGPATAIPALLPRLLPLFPPSHSIVLPPSSATIAAAVSPLRYRHRLSAMAYRSDSTEVAISPAIACRFPPPRTACSDAWLRRTPSKSPFRCAAAIRLVRHGRCRTIGHRHLARHGRRLRALTSRRFARIVVAATSAGLPPL